MENTVKSHPSPDKKLYTLDDYVNAVHAMEDFGTAQVKALLEESRKLKQLQEFVSMFLRDKALRMGYGADVEIERIETTTSEEVYPNAKLRSNDFTWDTEKSTLFGLTHYGDKITVMAYNEEKDVWHYAPIVSQNTEKTNVAGKPKKIG